MDANPLNKSLPAEIVSRRRHQVKKVEVKPTDEVEVELRVALGLKPEARLKWLTKAFDMAKDGRTSSRELFDIISNRRFTAGLPFKIGRKIRSLAQENATLFSERQRRQMQADEWVLNAKYGADMDEVRDDEDKGDDDTGPQEREEVHYSQTRQTDRSSRTRRLSDGDADLLQKKSDEEDELAKRIALERRLAKEEQERRLKREERKRQTGVDADSLGASSMDISKQQLEDEVDSSLQMLERLSHRQQPEEVAPTRGRRGRRTSRSRSIPGDRRGYRRRDASRSRSVSVQAASPSPVGKRRRGGKESFEEALAKRLADRESRDTTSIPVTWTREDMRQGRHLEKRIKWASGGQRIL